MWQEANGMTAAAEAALFVYLLFDKGKTEGDREALVRLWNEDHKRRERK